MHKALNAKPKDILENKIIIMAKKRIGKKIIHCSYAR